MKTFFLLLSLLACLQIKGQNTSLPVRYFDPEHEPVAIRSSDSSLQLIVSEYVLAKSIKARLGQSFQLNKVYKHQIKNGKPYLIFEGIYNTAPPQSLALGLLMIPDAQGKYYYASTLADMTCGVVGCENCSIVNGECTGCCPNSSSNFANPLMKVPAGIDQ